MLPKKKKLYTSIQKQLQLLKQVSWVLKLVWSAHPLSAIAIPILTFVSGVLPGLYLYTGKKVLDGISTWLQGNAEEGKRIIIIYLSISVIIKLIIEISGYLSRLLEELLRSRLTFHVQKIILDKAQSLDISYFENASFFDHFRRAQQEAGYRPYTIISSLIAFVRRLVTVCSYMTVLFTLAWWIVPFILVVLLPGLWINAKYGKKGWSIRYQRTPEERKMAYLQSLLTSNREAKEIRLFGLGEYLMGLWKKAFLGFYRQDRGLAIRRNCSMMFFAVIQTIGSVLLYSYVIHRAIIDPLVTIGSVVMFNQAMERVIASISMGLQSLGMYYENSLYIGNLMAYLKQEPQLIEPISPVAIPSVISEGICFESVRFRYPGTKKDVINNVSFEIKPGQSVAIVGENGSGKTTLVKLLSRLYDSQEGQITVDGINLRYLNSRQWQREIGVIFQDFAQYWLSVKENIGFGRIEFMNNEERLTLAANLAGVSKCIEQMEYGWDTTLGRYFNEGQELSIGEWQKIALARAFFSNSRILIMDEPTASVDAKQEYEIFKQFRKLAQGKIAIVISHRFSTVKMADRILVLEKGSIIESGTHGELMVLGGKYAEMFNCQALAYV